MFGERIRSLRKEKGMTLRELADDLGIPFTTLGNYEREDRQPSFETLLDISQYFNVSFDYLVGNNNQKTFDEYVFFNDTSKLEVLLKNADPELRTMAVDAYDQLYLLLKTGLEKKDIQEIEILKKILFFIFRMKNGFPISNFKSDDIRPSNAQEMTLLYLQEMNELNDYFLELYKIYMNRNPHLFSKEEL